MMRSSSKNRKVFCLASEGVDFIKNDEIILKSNHYFNMVTCAMTSAKIRKGFFDMISYFL